MLPRPPSTRPPQPPSTPPQYRNPSSIPSPHLLFQDYNIATSTNQPENKSQTTHQRWTHALQPQNARTASTRCPTTNSKLTCQALCPSRHAPAKTLSRRLRLAMPCISRKFSATLDASIASLSPTGISNQKIYCSRRKPKPHTPTTTLPRAARSTWDPRMRRTATRSISRRTHTGRKHRSTRWPT